MYDFIKVPALGRPFKVGELYNTCTDSLVEANFDFFNAMKLLLSITTDSIDKTSLQVLTAQDLDDVLGLSGGLKLSLLTGLVIFLNLEWYGGSRMGKIHPGFILCLLRPVCVTMPQTQATWRFKGIPRLAEPQSQLFLKSV